LHLWTPDFAFLFRPGAFLLVFCAQAQDRKHMKAFEKLFSRPENNYVSPLSLGSFDNSISTEAQEGPV